MINIDMIWAQDESGGIGKNGKLPWNISEDLQNFKKITLGHPIIMGRKTWESLPFKPLPKRRNIVLSSQKVDNIETYNSIDKCKDFVGESIPVTLNNGKLVGIITEGDLFQIFLKVSSEEKELENRD